MAPWNREARLYGYTSWDDTSLQEGMRSTQSGWGEDPASAAAEQSCKYVELDHVRRLSLLVCTAVYGLAVQYLRSLTHTRVGMEVRSGYSYSETRFY